MISFQKQKSSSKELYALLNPLIRDWFKHRFNDFTEPQKYAIPLIHNKKNVLVSAETGTGKTLSAFTSILNELIYLSQANQLEDKIYCVYISPLRALNNDIERNLLEPLNAIKEKLNQEIRVGVRTGDTTQSERSKQLKKPPHLLVTTPESLAILLNAPKFRENLRGVQWLIVDEIHALANNKRGVHLSLTMERLQQLSPEMKRIGLSATISPLKKVAEFLVGLEKGKPRECKIIDVSFLKKMDLKVISPLPDLINVSQEKIRESLYNELNKLIQAHKTTLIFTNTRAGTERVVHNLKELFPKNYSKANIEAHHSSIERELRLNTEQRLKEGKLKAVVSSTSLELGIDIGFVDLVILLGSPKSIARAIQRIGRSGHQLHETVKGRIIVLDRDDLIECSVLVKDALEKKIDLISIPENALDVLAQQIYGIAIAEKIQFTDLFELIKKSYCYRNLDLIEFEEVINYLSGEYTQLEARYVYGKIWHDKETGLLGRRGKMARIIYMTNIGTIPDEARIKVKLGTVKIGSIDEGFLEKLSKGDVFVLGGEKYEFRYAQGMTAFVKTAEKRPPTVPSWVSESLPLSFELGLSIQRFRKLMNEKFTAKKTKKELIEFIEEYLKVKGKTAEAIYNYFKEQFKYLEIPHLNKLIIEQYKHSEYNYLIFHSLYGRRVNDVLSRVIAYILSKLLHKDLEISLNDNGFIIIGKGKMPIEKAMNYFNSKELRIRAERAIENSELLNRRFRHCAARSLMILRNYKGKTKTAGRQQMSSRLLISAVRRVSNEFSILREARREVLEDVMDIDNAEKVVQGIEQGKIKIKILQSELPSPFAFNLFLQGKMDVMKMEDRLTFIKRMHEEIMQKINEKN
jgi:ATP-dependent helicase Lhr and Lhr-like helicase